MSRKLILITPDKSIDITPIVGNITLDSDIDTLGQSLSFDLANSDTKFFPKNPCDLGHIVVLTNGSKELYRGIIVSEQKDGRYHIAYRSFDFAFHLNQSTVVYQFNKTVAANAAEAIKKICKDFGMSIGSILNMSPVIKKIYIQESPAAIIKDIIDQVEKQLGFKILMEMRGGKLYIEKRNDLVVDDTFQLADNLIKNKIIDAIGDPTRHRSIEEMRNSIKIIVRGEKDTYTVKATANDKSLIDKYGLLQHTETIDEEDIAKARTIANNKLKELGRVFEDNSIRLIGHDDVRAGRIIQLNEPITGITGKWLIKSVMHTISGGQHFMDVNLGVIT
ncbi:hypothetical protein M6D81_11845 [Paenibacillus sp. J5C_2022]|uniref:XkdQ/YqbQ family protein n=1 Tax=Paenibacillus sp. J5C2022 TaxID=2977129 RepID=UPI0021D11861|nr:hypothetical protein [Paenibacillus sp. J5C2022]MCU6709397.1 hypothetical protein [Paenibacillus sp. J5C2022]